MSAFLQKSYMKLKGRTIPVEDVAQSVRLKEVREVMKNPVATVEEDTPLPDVVELMLLKQKKQLMQI